MVVVVRGSLPPRLEGRYVVQVDGNNIHIFNRAWPEGTARPGPLDRLIHAHGETWETHGKWLTSWGSPSQPAALPSSISVEDIVEALEAS